MIFTHYQPDITSPTCSFHVYLLCLLLILTSQAPTFAQETTISRPPKADYSIQPERNFGFVIGDILTQTIRLPKEFERIDLSTLSEKSRVSTWLERQEASLQESGAGNYSLVLRYQIINSPENIQQTALPELILPASKTGANSPILQDSTTQNANTQPDYTLLIEAWPFSLGPLSDTIAMSESAANTAPGLERIAGNKLRADTIPPELDTAVPTARLKHSSLLLLIVLASWAGWYLWRNHHDRVRLPFAKAVETLQALDKNKHEQNLTDKRWTTLHHAFNQCAGFVVNSSSLDTLFRHQPWLSPLDKRIQAFFEASAARYFELPARDVSFALNELADELALYERRNSR